MTDQRLMGLALAFGGVALFVVGVMTLDSFTDRMTRFFTGRVIDATVWYMFAGIALGVVGGMMVGLGGPQRNR